VTLTAVADASSTFVSWTGCDTTVGPTCNVTMTADRIVTATFDQAGSLYVVNSTTYTIAELYVSPAGAGTWGPTQLDSPILPAGTFTLNDIPVGTYDFRAVASNGVTFWQTSSVAITSGAQSDWILLQPAVGSLSVVNNTTTYTITELYVSPAGSGTWGPDQLATQIDPLGTFTLTDIPVGSYDLMAVASDGTAFWTNTTSITDGGLVIWTLMPPDAGSLAVVNSHCVALTELYVRPSSSPIGPNQLVTPVDPGVTFTLTAIPVGTYDVNAVGIDGTTWATNGIPITAGGTFTWTLLMSAGTGCLTVVNNTLDTLDLLFDPLSPSGCASNIWGNEQLNGSIILPGASFTLSNVPQGAHDLWASGVTPFGEPANYLFCGAGIPGGGTVSWYLGGPP
jgi:hypothetical protein